MVTQSCSTIAWSSVEYLTKNEARNSFSFFHDLLVFVNFVLWRHLNRVTCDNAILNEGEKERDPIGL